MSQTAEQGTEILIVDRQQIIVYASQGFAELVHCPPVKAGQPVQQFLPDFPDFHQPGHTKKQQYQQELPVTFPLAGKEYQMYIFSRCSKQREETLFYKKALAVLLDSIDEGVIVTDQHCKLLHYNKVQQEFDNLAPEEVLGKKTWEVQEKITPEETVLIRSINEKKTFLHYQQIYVIKNKYRRVDGCAYPIIIDDKVKGGIGVYRNLSPNAETACKVIYAHQKKNKSDSSLRAKQLYTFRDIICHDSHLKKSLQMAKSAAHSTSAVLIFGETGTGKELVAQSIHSQSQRRNRPFVAINCSALPENLIESILFGTKKGAFTGAENKKGLIEKASGGTLFLDEINSMTLPLQNKLLRVLEEKKVRRIGGYKEVSVDLRVISCINKPPQKAIEFNELKPDLFYRLAVVLIPIPPLRKRTADIVPLTERFIEELNKEFQRNISHIAPETLDIMRNAFWPGNVRQLRHYIECIYNLIPPEKKMLSHSYLPEYFTITSEKTEATHSQAAPAVPVPPKKKTKNIFQEIQEKEKKQIVEMLHHTGGNVSKAARQLGITRKALQYRLGKYELI